MNMQIIEIDSKQFAVLPIEDYRGLLEAAEDQADLAAAIASEKRREAGEEYFPSAMVDRCLA
jgi:hypothetical protein